MGWYGSNGANRRMALLPFLVPGGPCPDPGTRYSGARHVDLAGQRWRARVRVNETIVRAPKT